MRTGRNFFRNLLIVLSALVIFGLAVFSRLNNSTNPAPLRKWKYNTVNYSLPHELAEYNDKKGFWRELEDSLRKPPNSQSPNAGTLKPQVVPPPHSPPPSVPEPVSVPVETPAESAPGELPFKVLTPTAITFDAEMAAKQPPKPVGVMSKEECMQYVKKRKWTDMSNPKSQEFACTPKPPYSYLRNVGEDCVALSDGEHPPYIHTLLCWLESSCEAQIRARRLRACDESAVVSSNATMDKFLHQKVGPDSFRVRFDGPEVMEAPMTHLGKCEYRGGVNIGVSGWYTIQAHLLLDSYKAVLELNANFGYSMASIVDGKSYRVEFKCNKSTKYPPHPLSDDLPKCASIGTEVGRWVRPEEKVGVLDPFPGWTFPRTPGKNIATTDNWGSSSLWTPYKCTWKNYTQTEALTCLANQKIAFFGDSQTRSLFYPFVNKLWFNTVNRTKKIRPEEGMKRWNVGSGVVLDYYPDSYLNDKNFILQLFSNETLKYDVVIIGIGNWPASASIASKEAREGRARPEQGMWPFTRFNAHIDQLADALAGWHNKNPTTRLIYHTVPAFGIADFDVWRNNRRLELFNEYATKRLSGEGSAVQAELLDLYHITRAMSHAADDGGHHLTFVADQEADILTHMLCNGK